MTGLPGFSTLVPMTGGTATLRTDTDPKLRRRVSSRVAAKRGQLPYTWRLVTMSPLYADFGFCSDRLEEVLVT